MKILFCDTNELKIERDEPDRYGWLRPGANLVLTVPKQNLLVNKTFQGLLLCHNCHKRLIQFDDVLVTEITVPCESGMGFGSSVVSIIHEQCKGKEKQMSKACELEKRITQQARDEVSKEIANLGLEFVSKVQDVLQKRTSRRYGGVEPIYCSVEIANVKLTVGNLLDRINNSIVENYGDRIDDLAIESFINKVENTTLD